MNLKEYPETFWHCYIKLVTDGSRGYSVYNDLSFTQLKKEVIEPWLESRPFSVSGKIVKSHDAVEGIKITHTTYSKQQYADQYNYEMRAKGIGDLATDRRMLPIHRGTDYTNEFLFNSDYKSPPQPDILLLETLCKRISYSARILANRRRKNKEPYVVEDEYDVQDLLHAIIKAYFKHSVQENPLQKVANTSYGIVDFCIEEIGAIVEVKYVRGPEDQKRIVEDFTQDLLLYTKWEPLQVLLFVVYNSGDLKDPEALEKLGGIQEINGKRFEVKMVMV